MPRADVDIFFSTNKPAFAYIDGAEAVADGSAVAAGSAGPVDVVADLTGAAIDVSTSSVTSGLTVSSDTFQSIGMVWDIDPAVDPADSSVSVRYRIVGAPTWSSGSDLIRTDEYVWHFDSFGRTYLDVYISDDTLDPAGLYYATRVSNFSGSLMFLTPGTTYEVELTLTIGGIVQATHVFQARTRDIPRKPVGGRSLFVIPGGGGGTGSDLDPFQGLDAANTAAQPGDRLFLRSGTYAKATLTSSGGEDNHIVYEPDLASPGAVVDAMAIAGDHIWIDNLTFTYSGGFTPATGLFDEPWEETSAVYVPFSARLNEPDDILVTNCSISDYENGVMSFYALSRWVCMDNTIVGPWAAGRWTEPPPASSAGKGISIGGEGTPGGPGCVAAYNDVTRCTDGVNSGGDSDCYGNNIWDCRGNSTSHDNSERNVRCWGNRMHQSASFPLTFQIQKSGPWYYLYNQIAETGLGIFKWKVQDRFVFINNTFIGGTDEAHYFMRCFMRNNLFVRESGTGAIWTTNNGFASKPDTSSFPYWTADWFTDVDYDGFDWGGTGTAFNWDSNTTAYTSIAALSAAAGIEQNGIEVDGPTIFDDFTVSPTNALILAAGANVAYESGQEVPNLADFDYLGSAPDLGCHPRNGTTALHFGPRAGGEISNKTEHWVKH